MELMRNIWRGNTRILTFLQRKVFDVTRYNCSCSSFSINQSVSSVNERINEGWMKNVRSTSPRKNLEAMSATPAKVVIIGAGAAGVAAASRLFENGIHDIIILEAENRIGGRIHSVDFDGGVVDLGAQWCHGEKGNVVYDLVKDLDLLGSSKNDYSDFTFFVSDRQVVNKTDTDRLLSVAYEVGSDEEAAKKAGGTFGDYFISEYQKRVAEINDEKLKRLSEMLVDWFHKLLICLDPAKSWFDLSSAGPFQYKECEGDLYLHWKDKGFKAILDVLMKKVPDASKQLPLEDKICLNRQVDGVTWDSNVTVHCSDNSTFICDYLITTVSLGVLKHLSKEFVPKLPEVKQRAIDIMAIGDVNKICLKFPRQWWSSDTKGFSFVWNQDDRNKLLEQFPHGPSENGRSWLEDIFGFYVIDNHPNVLLGWVVGKMVAQIEQLPDDLVVDGCMFLLKKFLGHEYNVIQPESVLRSAWKCNPHFNGCYSYRCLEADLNNIPNEDLSSPVINSLGRPVLLFAGEATHDKYFSTVHGAIESGFREADRILNSCKSAKLIHRKVAIIGAGMAGLGAATTLCKLGCTDFVVVEAQNKPGGRIHTMEWNGNILELGAQWIHGKENSLYEFAREHDLLSEITSEEGLGLYIRDNGEIVDEDIVKRVDFEVGRILGECEEFVDSADYPGSVGEFMEAKFMEYLNNCHDSDDDKAVKLELLDWHVRFQIIDNSCMDLRKLSAKGWGQYICVDDKAHINLKCGYDELVKILVDKLPRNSLLLSTPVVEIQRSGTNTIICDNGSIITCEHLIVTPALGVLKRLKITPVLPREIAQSIERLGFDAIGKIFLIFDYKWWDADGFQLVWRRGTVLDGESAWVRHITGFDPVCHGPAALVGWIGGEGVEIMENLSEEVAGRHCVDTLRRFLRDGSIPDPVKVVKTSWLSNPWIRGGYSHITPECDRSALGMHKLSDPIFVDGKPRILMAGEAAHRSHYSTTHGAFESGQKQAEILVQYLKNSKL